MHKTRIIRRKSVASAACALSRFSLFLLLTGLIFPHYAFPQNLTTLVSFSHNVSGSGPAAGIIQATDGNFYGTTFYGGSNGHGTIFKITPAGSLTTLAAFDFDNGRWPRGELVQGTDGNLYGATYLGGSDLYGVIFKMPLSGDLSTLRSQTFSGGAWPTGGLVEGGDGAFYGTTDGGGADGYGAVFKILTNGFYTRLVSFDGDNGNSPAAGLVLANDGNFYGTTYSGGTSDRGSIFKMTSSGLLTNLVSFPTNSGAYPRARLIQGSDGDLYGTTYEGGPSNNGTVFRVSLSGVLTTLASFNVANGSKPRAALIESSNGVFYGTTELGGANNLGTVFKITADGTLTTIAAFNDSNGAYPYGELIKGDDGFIYGTTSGGGTSGAGTVFRLSLASSAPAITAQPQSLIVNQGDSASFSVEATGSEPLAYQWLKNGSPISDGGNVSGANTDTLSIFNVQPSDAGSFAVTISNLEGFVESDSVFLTVQTGSSGCVQAPSGLLSWWDGETDPIDIYGPNAAKFVNATSGNYSIGKVGLAFAFNGTSFLQAPTTNLPTGGGDRTLEAWVKVENFTSGETFFAGYGNFGTTNQAFYLGANSNRFLTFSTWGNAVVGPQLNANQWYHIAVTTSNQFARVYVDGSEVVSSTLSGFNTPAGTQFYIGRLPGTLGNTRKLQGLVDDVRVYNRPLSGAEVHDIYLADSFGICVDAPVIISYPKNQTVSSESSVATFSVSAIGSSPLSYQWKKNGEVIAGATTSTLTINPTLKSTAGIYSVVVSNPFDSVQGAALLTVGTADSGLFPVLTSATNELTKSIAFDGTNYLVALLGESNATDDSSAIGAQLLSSSGMPIGSFISTGRNGFEPAVAFDGTNYLLVWDSYNFVFDPFLGPIYEEAIYGQFISRQGSVIGSPFTISTNLLSTDRSVVPQRPDVAFGGGKYFVAWNTKTNLSSFFEAEHHQKVRGRLLSAQGDLLGSELVISSLPGAEVAVASDGTNFLATWYKVQPDPEFPLFEISKGVVGQLISGSNTLIGANFNIETGPTFQYGRLDTVFDGSRYVIGFSTLISAPSSSDDDENFQLGIAARMISTKGVVSAGKFQIHSTVGFQGFPQIATDGFNYLFTWNTLFELRGRFFDSAMKPTSSEFLLLPNLEGKQALIAPAVFNGSRYFVVAALESELEGEGDLYGIFLTPSRPQIIEQPRNSIISAGETIRLNVRAAGEDPLFYQWRFNGSNLAGKTNSTLQIPNAVAANAGSYSVTVSNLTGRVISSNAVVTVVSAPQITQQPVNQNVAAGGSATFSAQVSGGAPLSFRWQLNGANIPGATNLTFTITNATARATGFYTLMVANPVGVTVSVPAKLSMSLPTLGLTDSFENRVVTSATSGSGKGSNLNATSQVGEPKRVNTLSGKTVWYSWIAATNGTAQFDTQGSSFDTYLTVYQGSSLNSLIFIESDDDSGGFFSSKVAFNAVAGTEYQIVIDGHGGANGDIVLNWTLTPNEEIPVIQQNPVSTVVAVGETGVFFVKATAFTPGPLSYQWFFQGNVIGTATGSALSIVNARAENRGFYNVRVSKGGQHVFTPPVALELASQPGSPTQDKFEDAVVLGSSLDRPLTFREAILAASFPSPSIGSLGTQFLSNTDSTREANEPIPQTSATSQCGVPSGASRWFVINPAEDAVLVVDTIGSAIDTLLAVYDTTNLTTSTLAVACDDNSAGENAALVRLPVTAGTLYFISVDGANGADVGDITLNWRLGQIPEISEITPEVDLPIGSAITLSATINPATSTNNLALLWDFKGVAFTSATNNTLNLSSLNLSDSGNYNITVTNDFGSATRLVTVNVYDPDKLRARITNPTNNFYTKGPTNMALTAIGSGPGFERIEFYQNAKKIGQATSEPYSLTWSNVPAGAYQLTAKALDAAGKSSTSAVVRVYVDNTKPTVTIASPAANAKVTNARLVASGTAKDNFSVARVLYSLNGAPFASASETLNWSASLLPVPGTNTLAVKAVDAAGNESLLVSRKFFYSVKTPLTLSKTGLGSFSPDLNGQMLEIGKGYLIKAIPASGQIFSNWNGIVSSNPNLTFLMTNNLSLTANFVTNPFIALKGTYNGLFFATNSSSVDHDSSGFLTLLLTDKGSFSGSQFQGGTKYSFTGQFLADGTTQVRVLRSGKTPLTNVFQLTLSPGETGVLDGSVTHGNWTSVLQAVRAAAPTVLHAGKYTMAISGNEDAALAPGGDSFGSIAVDVKGTVAFKGILADGTIVSQNVGSSSNGNWPFYIPLATGKASIFGWILFDSEKKDLGGEVCWIKTSGAGGKFYPAGFKSQSLTNVFGSVYTNSTPLLDFDTGKISLRGGNLTSIDGEVTFSGAKFISSNLLTAPLTLTISTANGFVNGSFTHPVTGLPVAAKGIILQNQNSARGFFLGTNQSGGLLIQEE